MCYLLDIPVSSLGREDVVFSIVRIDITNLGPSATKNLILNCLKREEARVVICYITTYLTIAEYIAIQIDG